MDAGIEHGQHRVQTCGETRSRPRPCRNAREEDRTHDVGCEGRADGNRARPYRTLLVGGKIIRIDHGAGVGAERAGDAVDRRSRPSQTVDHGARRDDAVARINA
jgi:hypothetical protein